MGRPTRSTSDRKPQADRILHAPSWRIETIKAYPGGASRRFRTEDLASTPEGELQKTVDIFHQTKMDEIVNGLRKLAVKGPFGLRTEPRPTERMWE
jgi:hypothetical protein